MSTNLGWPSEPERGPEHRRLGWLARMLGVSRETEERSPGRTESSSGWPVGDSAGPTEESWSVTDAVRLGTAGPSRVVPEDRSDGEVAQAGEHRNGDLLEAVVDGPADVAFGVGGESSAGAGVE